MLSRGIVIVSRREENGTETVVATLAAGHYFGETGMIHGSPRNATVTVSQAGEAAAFSCDSRVFRNLVAEAGGAAGDLALALNRRLQA